MSVLVTNNAVSTLLVGISETDTRIMLASGQGERFPFPTPDKDWFYITVQDKYANRELMKCTSREVDELTVVRGYGGTTALAFLAGSTVELRPCAELFNDKVDKDVFAASIATLQASINDFKTAIATQLTNIQTTIREQAEENKQLYVPYVGDSEITGTLKVSKLETPSIEMVKKE